MIFGAATDTGKIREKNEDNFRVDIDLSLFIVADGIGGHLAGEVASYIAVETIQDYLSTHIPDNHLPPEDILRNSMNAAHDAILTSGGGFASNSRMGTTAVVAWIPPPADTAWVAHVGDSRAYLMRGDKLRLLTDDHTLYLEALREGALPKNPKLWPPRQALSQALGASDVIKPDVSGVPLMTGDQLLLCTDGLTDMIPEDGIGIYLQIGKTPQETCETLIQIANANGGEDNVTAILIAFD
ncbi:MAG: SpoIIE family protein phosphatase [Anaerolineales bacterium]|nr:SpoIIE family protein phosphatase [Anaerolineales bacterium]